MEQTSKPVVSQEEGRTVVRMSESGKIEIQCNGPGPHTIVLECVIPSQRRRPRLVTADPTTGALHLK